MTEPFRSPSVSSPDPSASTAADENRSQGPSSSSDHQQTTEQTPIRSTSESLLESLLIQWQEARERGQPVTSEELCREQPHLLQPLRQRIAELESMLGFLSQTSAGVTVTHHPSDTVPEQAPTEAKGAGTIARFRLRARLGEGAFGEVYRAYDPLLDREVALKVAKPGTLTTRDRQQRFFREAKAAANLRHPNIVPLFETGQAGDRYFIATAFIQGGTLEKQLTEAKGPLTFERCVEVMRKLAAAMGYAHQQGIVHRDIKPANILLDDTREPLVADFGLAVRVEGDEKLTHEGAIMGTPSYMSPEQASGRSGEAGPASDQYALDVMLYEMLTGTRPFKGNMAAVLAAHINEMPKSPRVLNRVVPRDLETICLKCLEKDPSRRYVCCDDLAEDLRR